MPVQIYRHWKVLGQNIFAPIFVKEGKNVSGIMIYQMRQVITMKFEIPSKVETIIHTLEAAGFEAYAVGGCVRDAPSWKDAQ